MPQTTLDKKAVLFSVAGNTIEWCDYTLYAAFSVVFSKIFFPANTNTAISLIKVFAIFAAGYIARPFGAIFFGYIADFVSRRAAMTTSIGAMAVSTLLMGLIPSYEDAGYISIIFLALTRIVQGFAIGGEFSVSSIYIVENAPSGRAAFYGSFAMASLAMGIILGNIVFMYTLSIFDEEKLYSYAWRIPFIVSSILALCLAFCRSVRKVGRIAETSSHTMKINSIILKLWDLKKRLILGFGIAIGDGIPFYIFAIALRAILEMHFDYSATESSIIGIVIVFSYGVASLCAGRIADILTEKKVTLYGSLAIMTICIPTMLLLEYTAKGGLWVYLSVSAIGLCLGCYHGPLPSLFIKLFPKEFRALPIAICYNTSIVIFGSTAPIVCSFIVANFSNSSAIIGIYALFSLIIASVCIMLSKPLYK